MTGFSKNSNILPNYFMLFHIYKSIFSITLFILMNYLIHIDTIIMEMYILYFKGLLGKVSLK